MILDMIFSAKINLWEERITAAAFLNQVSIENLALQAETRRIVAETLFNLSRIPYGYAQEICCEVLRAENVRDCKF